MGWDSKVVRAPVFALDLNYGEGTKCSKFIRLISALLCTAKSAAYAFYFQPSFSKLKDPIVNPINPKKKKHPIMKIRILFEKSNFVFVCPYPKDFLCVKRRHKYIFLGNMSAKL